MERPVICVDDLIALRPRRVTTGQFVIDGEFDPAVARQLSEMPRTQRA